MRKRIAWMGEIESGGPSGRLRPQKMPDGAVRSAIGGAI
jgi:hypothetical protein